MRILRDGTGPDRTVVAFPTFVTDAASDGSSIPTNIPTSSCRAGCVDGGVGKFCQVQWEFGKEVGRCCVRLVNGETRTSAPAFFEMSRRRVSERTTHWKRKEMKRKKKEEKGRKRNENFVDKRFQ